MDRLFLEISKWFEKKEDREEFDEYLDIRKKYKSLEKKLKKENLKKNNISEKEKQSLKKEKKKIFKVLCEQELKLVDVSKGIFWGVGVDLKTLEDIVPVYQEWKKLHNHYFVYGTSQVGKSRALANHARQMILNNWNLIVVDPKGGENQEILSWIVEFAGEALRPEDLFYIAPVYSDFTDCINPVYSLGNEEIASMVQLLCMGGASATANDFFADFSYKVVSAILYALEFLETVTDPDGEIAKERINTELINYYQMMELKSKKTAKYDKLNRIITPDVATRMNLKHLKDRDNKKLVNELDFAFDRQLVTFKELAYYSNFTNLQKLIATMNIMPIPNNITNDVKSRLYYLKNQSVLLMRDLEIMDKNFFEKVSTSLTTLLTQLATGKIGQLFCTVKINPLVNRLFREDKGLICVVQPAPLKFQKVSEMVLKIILKMFESVFGVIGSSGRGMTRRVGLLIDEAKSVMYPGIEELYNKSAQLGMTIGGYTQSRGDIQYKLGDKLAEVVEDCVNTTLTLRTNSSKARDYIAGSYGTQRVHSYTYAGESSLTAGRMMMTSNDEDLVKAHHLKERGIGKAYYHHADKLFDIELPFQRDPYGAMVMPRLREEDMITGITKLEQFIEEEMSHLVNENHSEESVNYER